jgi:hypothetical protein
LKKTQPLWPPQRGVGLREPNLGKTNPRVTLFILLVICFAPSLADLIIFLTLTRLVVVINFVNFSFALFTPPLGDFHLGSVTPGLVPLADDLAKLQPPLLHLLGLGSHLLLGRRSLFLSRLRLCPR